MNAPDSVFLNISRRFRPEMSGDELYAAVRDAWKISEENRGKVQYALAVAHGKVRGIWRVQKWSPVDEKKWRFTGERDDGLWVQCAGRRVRMSYGLQYGNLEEFMNSSQSGEKEGVVESKNESKELQLLRQFGQIILYGPPGTGKTRAAKLLLPEILGADVDVDKSQGDRWDIAQFHPSYNYEDFVRGVQVETQDNQVAYETKNRIFGEICKRANGDRENNYALIIDEINRANVSAVLGELIYALEYRGGKIKTPYLAEDGSGDKSRDLVVPKNLFVIGTMNTADRTIGQIDYAVRRRFAFVHCPPNADVITDDTARDFFDRVDSLFAKGGEYMSAEFDGDDVRIGHSYFLTYSDAELGNKIIYQVVPILREYVRDGVLLVAAEKKIAEIENDAKKLIADESEDSSAEKESGFYAFHWSAEDGTAGLNGMGSTALNIVAHYAAKNEVADIKSLRRAFGMPEDSDNFVADAKDNLPPKSYFQSLEDQVSLSGGEKIVVSHQWGKPKSEKWKSFASGAEKLGFRIRRCHFVNIGEDDKQSRSWRDCERLGFLGAGGSFKQGGTDRLYAEGLIKLAKGEMVFAFFKDGSHKGIVGFGEVVAAAVPIRDFKIDGVPLLECRTDDGRLYGERYPEAAHKADDDLQCERILAVKWIKTVPPEEAVPIVGQRSVVWHQTNASTIAALEKAFIGANENK